MSGGEGSAAFKGIAQGADEALGNAGHALGEFVESTAQSADKATDAMLATEEQNAQAIAKVMPAGAASEEQVAGSGKFSSILDRKPAERRARGRARADCI